METTPQTRRNWRAVGVSNQTRTKAVSKRINGDWFWCYARVYMSESHPVIVRTHTAAQLLPSSMRDSTVQRSDNCTLMFRQHSLASLDQYRWEGHLCLTSATLIINFTHHFTLRWNMWLCESRAPVCLCLCEESCFGVMKHIQLTQVPSGRMWHSFSYWLWFYCFWRHDVFILLVFLRLCPKCIGL